MPLCLLTLSIACTHIIYFGNRGLQDLTIPVHTVYYVSVGLEVLAQYVHITYCALHMYCIQYYAIKGLEVITQYAYCMCVLYCIYYLCACHSLPHSPNYNHTHSLLD